jgi:DNA-binding MarR family transcriptional regulator
LESAKLDLGFEILNQLRKAVVATRQHSPHTQQTFGLTFHQIGLLLLIASHNPLSLGELAGKLEVHIVTAEEHVTRLHKKRLVSKSRPKSDRRRVEVSITQTGRRVLEQIPNVELPFTQNLKSVPEEELQTILKSLIRLTDLLGAPDAGRIDMSWFGHHRE